VKIRDGWKQGSETSPLFDENRLRKTIPE